MAQVSLSTRISPELNTALEQAAASTGQSKAAIVEAALRKYLEAQGA